MTQSHFQSCMSKTVAYNALAIIAETWLFCCDALFYRPKLFFAFKNGLCTV